MHVTRHDAAAPYMAPGHAGMRMARLQGKEAGPATQMWMGLSRIEPGGGTQLDASATEKLYFVLYGEVVFTGESADQRTEERLRAWDSCRFAPGEARQLRNDGPQEAAVLLVMALQHPPQADVPAP